MLTNAQCRSAINRILEQIMATAAARKAWNDAMKATAATALVPTAGRNSKRRSDRHKKQDRRTKARRVFHNAENDEFRTALWVDALEGVDPAVAAREDDEDYDQLEELQDDVGGKKRKRPAPRRKGQAKPGVMPKHFLPRSLGTILVEDPNRASFLAAEARVSPSQQLPRRKYCPVTGLIGIYKEPKSGIPYSSLKALEQIRERSPPWFNLGGSATYYEAVKSIEDA